MAPIEKKVFFLALVTSAKGAQWPKYVLAIESVGSCAFRALFTVTLCHRSQTVITSERAQRASEFILN